MTGARRGPPATGRPARLERAVRRRPPGGPRARRRRSGRSIAAGPSATGDGAGVTVAIIDSGVEGDHPAVGGAPRRERPRRAATARTTDGRRRRRRSTSSATARPARGSSTPSRRRPSSSRVRVLGAGQPGQGPRVRGRPRVGDRRAARRSSTSACRRGARRSSRTFHELADEAYFANCCSSAPRTTSRCASYPSLFAAVVSVAAHDVRDAETWFYNPHPPVEFGAYGLDVDVAWRDGGRIVATGNSFAAPHIAGLAARIRAAHPTATPVRGQDDPRRDGEPRRLIRRSRRRTATPRPGTERGVMPSGGSPPEETRGSLEIRR